MGIVIFLLQEAKLIETSRAWSGAYSLCFTVSVVTKFACIQQRPIPSSTGFCVHGSETDTNALDSRSVLKPNGPASLLKATCPLLSIR